MTKDHEPSDDRDRPFGGRRFVFWCTAPFLLLAAVVFAFTYTDGEGRNWTYRIAIPVLCVLALLGLYDTRRFAWAMRALTGVCFLALAWCFVDEVLLTTPDVEPTPAMEASQWQATRALIVFGLPTLWYTIFGRLDPRRRERPSSKQRQLEYLGSEPPKDTGTKSS